MNYGRILLDAFVKKPDGARVNMRIDPISKHLYAKFSDDTEIDLTEGEGALRESNSVYNIERTVTGSDITIKIEFETRGVEPIVINDIIPQDFLGKKWFKMKRYTSIISEVNPYDGFRVVPQQGTVTTEADSATVIGVGTSFTYIEPAIYGDVFLTDSNGNEIGKIISIESDTELTLEDNAAIIVSDLNMYFKKQKLEYNFGIIRFNDFLNSEDGIPYTTFDISGAREGMSNEFFGDGNYALTQSLDAELISTNYSGGEDVRNMSLSGLNMEYIPDKAQGMYYVPSEAGIVIIIINGYLI